MGRVLRYTFLDMTPSEYRKEQDRRYKIHKDHRPDCNCEICDEYYSWPYFEEDLKHQRTNHDLPYDDKVFTRPELLDMLKEYTEDEKFYEISIIARLLDEMGDSVYDDGICLFEYN